MKESIKCPICGGVAALDQEDCTVEHRGTSYTVVAHAYRCATCKEEFQTEEQIDLALGQIPGYIDNALNNLIEEVIKSPKLPAPPRSS